MKLKLETKNSRILKFMDENGSINQIEALQELGVMRLASRINDLRDSGYAIETKMNTKKVTLTGEEFAKIASKVANDIAFEEGISKAMEFTFFAAKLTALIFCNDDEEEKEE